MPFDFGAVWQVEELFLLSILMGDYGYGATFLIMRVLAIPRSAFQ